MAHWYTPDEAADAWRGAPDQGTLTQLLDVACGEVIDYAPALDPEDTEPLDPEDPESPVVQSVPVGYRWAHLAHARNIWNAQNTNPSGAYGPEGESFAFTPFPLDWAIKARLRPATIFGGTVG